MKELDLFKRQKLSRISDSFPEAIYITDPDGVISHVNPAFELLTGFRGDDVVGKSGRILKSGHHPESFYNSMWDMLMSGNIWSGQMVNKKRDGTVFPADVTIFPISDPADRISHFVAILHGTTAQLQAHEETLRRNMEYTALHNVSKILQTQDPLPQMLSRAVEEIIRLSELRIEYKAGVFIADHEKKVLRLYTTVGDFPEEFHRQDAEVPFGECLCGRVAMSGEMLVSNNCFSDPRHERKYEGMTAHGHYIIPLKSRDKMVGVLFLYTNSNPSWYERSPEILKSMGGLIADAIEHRRAEAIIQEQNETLTKMNELKNKFLGIAAHDLRNPVYVIRTFSEALRDECTQGVSDKHRRFFDKIYNASGHMIHLLENLLDISKIEQGKIEINRMIQDINPIIEEQVSLNQIVANKKEICIKQDLAKVPPFPFDKDALIQSINNFLSNAIKFSPPASTVLVTTELQGDKIQFSVKDQGVGLSEEEQKLLFGEFQTLSSKPTGQEKATGLGLAIVKKIITLHGGEVGVVSQPGHGSTFYFLLPVH
ncbi:MULTISPECIES: sensor histidine kinase [unclassified Nitrospina]|uniref:sensor histidine kinase n=1 Tax=unclassified Nitrospina TaxID=2638683 RepID=UPI003F988E96